MSKEPILRGEYWAPASFHHPKNIRIGKGRILWAPQAVDTSGNHHPEGWVLPGGLRTDNSERAHAVALAIDALCAVQGD